jgi:putative membrane protein
MTPPPAGPSGPPEEPDGDERRTSLADERTSLAGQRTSLAGQRTSLAGERTLLAWWRTGLASLAVALGVGRLLPVLAPKATRWPYVVLGAGFAVYGIAMFLLGTRRMREQSADDTALLAFMGAGAILGIGTLAMILAQ